MPTEGTPIELKDIKPGDVVRAEWLDNDLLWTCTGPVVVDDYGNLRISSHKGYLSRMLHMVHPLVLISRPEVVIDKEDLKLGQRVRIEMKPCGTADDCLTVAIEGVVVTFWGNLLGELTGGQLSGANGGNFYADCITKVVLLS